MLRKVVATSILAFVVGMIVLPVWGDALPHVKERLLGEIKYLASDELEGRGVGTKGLDLAAEFVKSEFAKAGLAVDRVNGDAFQKFDVVTGSKLAEPTSLQLIGPAGVTIDLKIGTDVEACSFGGSGAFDGDVVFCGYGINTEQNDASERNDNSGLEAHAAAPLEKLAEKVVNKIAEKAADHPAHQEIQYNDFGGIDVEGKIVIVMRRNPRQSDSKGPFTTQHGISRHADLRSKMKKIAAQKAAAVLFVNDPYAARKADDTRRQNEQKADGKVVGLVEEFLATEPADIDKTSSLRQQLADAVKQTKSLREAKVDDDALMKFGYAGAGDSASKGSAMPPAFHIHAATCDQMLAASDTNLARLEAGIDSDLQARSFVVSGWKAKGALTVEKIRTDVANVIGVIDGAGPLADETLIVGAHYDHVGRGGPNSLAPGSTDIHNGADDNASGTVTLLELARRFGLRSNEHKLPRRLVFIAFTGEEMGLLGSARYCKQPVFPLENTIAMLNMDMVGRLKDDKLIVYGTGTSPRWQPELEKFNAETGFRLVQKPEGFGPSDHSSFYAKKIPVLHFFTGEHADYHKPTDDWEKINIDGVVRVADLMEKLIVDTLNQPERPEYKAVKGASNPTRGGDRPYVGTIPEFGNEDPGYSISGVSPGSPAEKGGLKAGDRIVKLGTHKVTNLQDFDVSLRKFAPGEDVEFGIIRDNKDVTIKVKLDPPRN